VAVGDRLLQLGVIPAKALAESLHPIAAPPHAHEIIRRRQREKDRKENIVNDSH
jgi:hypothetical protein